MHLNDVYSCFWVSWVIFMFFHNQIIYGNPNMSNHWLARCRCLATSSRNLPTCAEICVESVQLVWKSNWWVHLKTWILNSRLMVHEHLGVCSRLGTCAKTQIFPMSLSYCRDTGYTLYGKLMRICPIDWCLWIKSWIWILLQCVAHCQWLLESFAPTEQHTDWCWGWEMRGESCSVHHHMAVVVVVDGCPPSKVKLYVWCNTVACAAAR
jgi:hypothetical protein